MRSLKGCRDPLMADKAFATVNEDPWSCGGSGQRLPLTIGLIRSYNLDTVKVYVGCVDGAIAA